MNSPTVAAVGAGNVGCALAVDLAIRGCQVRVFNRSPERPEAVRAAVGINVSGEVEGLAAPALVTDWLEEAIGGADVVAVTVPTCWQSCNRIPLRLTPVGRHTPTAPSQLLDSNHKVARP
jgi:predicted dinucleotide-binding enzyme